MNILVVDDIAANRKLLRVILESEGHFILEAADGVEALAVLNHTKVDAIISDILMPRMDGFRFCYEVRASDSYRHLPFIFYTANYTSSSDEKLAFEMGADKFLIKPVPASEMILALREVLTGPRRSLTVMEPSQELNLMKEYNQRLVAKLEQKNIELISRNEELIRSEQKMSLQSTALETAANGVLIVDTNGIILWVNSAFVTLTGYTSEEAVGKTPRLLKSGQHGREFYQELWRTILAGHTWRGNFINRRKNGNIYQDEHTITPVRSKQGVITHFVAIMNDVTGRKRAEQKLRESEERLEMVTEKMSEGLVLSDLDGHLLRWNRAALEMHAFASDDERRDQLSELTKIFELSTIDGAILPLEQWPLSRILRNEDIRNLEVRLRRIGSEWQRIFSHSGAIVREASGKQTAFLTINDITERKKSEQRLTLLAACVSQLNDIVLITESNPINEPGPRIVFVNEAFERITGYTSAEAIGPSPRFLQGAKTDRRILTEIRLALAQHQPIRRQIINYGKEGNEYWLDMDIVPIFDVLGKCTHFVAIESDISEAKKNEEQLLWKTAFFEAQVHSALDGILIVDGEGNKILQNQRMVDLWALPLEIANDSGDQRQFEWICHRIKMPRQFAEKVAYLYAHPDEVSHDEIELIDGRFFYRYSAPVRGKDGKYYGRIWAFRDMTDRKLAEAQIAEQAAFLDKARDAILVRDLAGNILFWNKGAERMYGWPRQEVVGRNIGEFLYTDPKKFEEVNDLTISRGEWHGELQHLTKERNQITVEGRWTLIRDNEGHPKSVLAINTDVTERKKIEAQFLRAQRMESIGTLAGGVAHDLNNILAPIMMGVEILKGTSDDSKTAKILEMIEVSAKRGADIVRQVLSFARGLEGTRIEVQPKHLLRDLKCIIKDTFPKNIQLSFSIPNDTWTIFGDPTQVGQILMNLSVNARDAMPNGGTLTIGVENCVIDEQYAAMNIEAKPGRHVKISVTDSGAGIPPDLRKKIFEPFFTTKELNKGTGLGLSTVAAIVKGHGGILNVYSELRKGTTFKIYLPAMEISSAGRKQQSEPVTMPRGNGEMVLIVDDEASFRSIISQTLQAFGYRVLTATDGAEAMAVYTEHKNEIAVVLTDMMMPVMSGPVTIRALMRINPAIKVIATSGLDAESAVAEARGAGAKHFLTKPYSAQTLLQVVRAILEES